mgnify:CR=1 FL=1
MDPLHHFREVWAVDFEFTAPPGEQSTPLCVVAREVLSGRLVRAWLAGATDPICPYSTGPDVLFVAYYASAELGCHLALGWPSPVRILDLFAEFRNHTNGRAVSCGNGLLGALAHFGLDAIAGAEKDAMRELALRGGPYTADERAALLDYCQTDVDALARLLPAMTPHLDLPLALIRGRYMAAVARMEWVGVPIDVTTLDQLRTGWDHIKAELVRRVDRQYGVFVPAGRPPLNPASKFGAAVMEAAHAGGYNPDALAAAAEHVHATEREALAERLEAVQAARKATGLTNDRVQRLLDIGKDHLDVPGFDVQARQLAGEYPDLGIGIGYDPDGPDEDYGPKLWAVLCEPDPVPLPKHHPDTIRRAAELVTPGERLELPDGPLTFSAARWADYLRRAGIAWPARPDGALALDDDTFREMAKLHPEQVGPMRELRHALGQLRLNELAVGSDGRNRLMLSAFRSLTGRNQPSNSRFIFGPSAWLRSLIRPEPGRALAYVDWSQQELGIAAALSGDANMREAYRSGDFYLTFAVLAGAAPADATKKTHARIRDQFKQVALAVQYGQGEVGLAAKLGLPVCRGRELLQLHRRTFRRFWEWSDTVQDGAMLGGELRTVFGWKFRAGRDANPRSLRNFPMQANGAEMMRLAAMLATERGIRVCCPVHDAFLIEADEADIEAETGRMQQAMAEASELVLPGFPLKTDAKIVRHPERYADDRGRVMWQTVAALIGGANRDPHPERCGTGTVRGANPPSPYSSSL